VQISKSLAENESESGKKSSGIKAKRTEEIRKPGKRGVSRDISVRRRSERMMERTLGETTDNTKRSRKGEK